MLTVQRRRRVEVWDALACEAGERLAVLTRDQQCRALVTIEGDDRLVIQIANDARESAELLEDRVIRVDEDDATFDEWRISAVTRDRSSGISTIEAAPIDRDLQLRAILAQTDGLQVTRHNIDALGLTPDQIIDAFVLPALAAAGLSWVQKGTVAPTAPLDVTIAWDTPLAVLRRLAAETATEFQLRRDGVAGYLIDLIPQIGASAEIADFRSKKNLDAFKQQRATTEQATRIYPRGGDEDGVHATMASASWKVISVVGNDVELGDPASGVGPIMFDGQLAGLNGTTAAYLRRPDGTLTLVTASVALTQIVTVADATGIAADDLVEFRANSNGDDLTWLDSPPDRLTYRQRVGVLDRPNIPSTHNLIRNPGMRDWPGAVDEPPTNWAKRNTVTIAKQVGGAFSRVAQQAIHVTGTADGTGVESDTVELPISAQAPYVSGYASIWVVSGQVRVELVFTTPSGPVVFPAHPNVASSSGTGVWLDLGASGEDAIARQATAVAIRIVQHGATAAEFYVDAAQVTVSAAQLPYVEGAGATRLWQAANERLRTGGGPAVTYDLTVIDLARLDPARWGDDAEIVLGRTVRVTEPSLAVAIQTRITALERNYLVAGESKIVLSTNPDDLTGTLARPKKPPRRGAGGLGPNARPAPPIIQYSITSTGQLTLVLRGDGTTARFRAIASKTGMPTDADVRVAASVAAVNGVAQIANVLTLAAGQVFYVNTFAYSESDVESDHAQLTDSWENTPSPAPTIGTAIPSDTEITYPFTYDISTQRIEVWAQEHNADPGAAVSVEHVGFRAPGQPLDRTDGRTSIAIAVAKAGHWLLVTFVPFDQRGRRGASINRKTQAAAVPPPAPDPPTAVVNFSTAVGTCTNTVTMPADITDFDFIRTFRDGVQFGSDVTRTAGASATQNVTHSGLADGVTHTWKYEGVSAAGIASTGGPSVQVTQPGGGGSVLPTPSHALSGYDTATQSFTITVTPGDGTPNGVEYVPEVNVDGSGWIEHDPSSSSPFTFYYLQTGAAQVMDTRVFVRKSGWTDSLPSAVQQIIIPAR